MPGAVVVATVSAVMPFSLFTKFSIQIQRKANINYYANGESQAGALVGAERRHWDVAKRLTGPVLATLAAFFVGRNGKQRPFYIYDITLTGVVWDNTGVLTTGRYAVCFDNDTWSHSIGLGRANTGPFSFTEIG